MAVPGRMRSARFVVVSDSVSSTRFGWWLLAANNRPIARAASASGSIADAAAAAVAVRDGRDALGIVIGRDPSGRQWRWAGSLDGRHVAVPLHGYARRAECARALDGFMQALPAAEISAGPLWARGPRALHDAGDPPITATTRSPVGRRA